jgi:hypothetical protein
MELEFELEFNGKGTAPSWFDQDGHGKPRLVSVLSWTDDAP